MINNDPENLVTIKEHFLVQLDSRNANIYNNGDKLSNVTFDFEEPIKASRDTLFFSCSVLSFTAPNSIYNINETNNILHVVINGITQHYEFNYGNYNYATMLQTLKATIDPSLNVTFNTLTNKFTFTHSTYDFTITNVSTIGSILGFSKNTNYSSTNKTLTLPYTCNFNGLNSFNVVFANLNTNNIDSFNKSNSSIIQSIPIEAGNNQILFRRTFDYSFRIKQDTIDFINIQLLDDLENFINLNNQHWTLTLQFSIIRDINRFTHNSTFFNVLQQDFF